MTLTEAIYSGKRFKRRGGVSIYWVAKDAQGHHQVVMFDPTNPHTPRLVMRVEPVIATDWEIVTVPDNVIEFKRKG